MQSNKTKSNSQRFKSKDSNELASASLNFNNNNNNNNNSNNKSSNFRSQSLLTDRPSRTSNNTNKYNTRLMAKQRWNILKQVRYLFKIMLILYKI